MTKLTRLKTFTDSKGCLNVLDRQLPFQVKRVYYIYSVPGDAVRAGHRHKKNDQVLVCVNGSCKIFVDNGQRKETFILQRPDEYLILAKEDWHTMSNFSADAVLLILASEPYDVDDYIDEAYP